jgi:hypothetical protein
MVRRSGAKNLEPIAKLPFPGICHSERSEESRIFNNLRSFTSFRMKIKTGFAIASSIFKYPDPWRAQGDRKTTILGCLSGKPSAQKKTGPLRGPAAVPA